MCAMIRTIILLLAVGWATCASAHGSLADDLSAGGAWTTDLGVIVPLVVSGALFIVGTHNLWRRAGHGRGVRHRQVGAFWTGWAILALALLSPLHWLSEHCFAAHMVEHEVIMIVAAPLLVLARPIGAFMWALPPAWRRSLGGLAHQQWFASSWRRMTQPTVSSLLHAAAIWGWHIPSAFSAALRYDSLHWLQHLSFFVTALLFWWSLLFGREGRSGYGQGVFWLFITALHTSALGILLTLSRTPWIPFQTDVSQSWGLSPLEDQQLAGLIMWVPAGIIYTGVALCLAAIWVTDSGASLRGGYNA
jgi:cytochrome c oxidase assembly factor CtaG